MMTTPTDELRAIAEAPERIWLLDWPDADATWCQDPDPDGEHADSVEYVRADRLAALEADQRLYPAALIRLAEYAEMIAALEAERAAGGARVVELCSFVFLAGHSEGWTGNQCRRDVQHVDAEKGWHLYVQNGALEKANARAALAKQEPGP